MSKNGPRELTNDTDDTVVELCNPETGEVMPIATRHDGGKRAKKLREAGWRLATEKDRQAAVAKARQNGGR